MTLDTSSGGGAAGFVGSGPNGQVTPEDISRIQHESEQEMTPAQRAESDNAETPEPPLGAFGDGDTLALLAQRAEQVQAVSAPEHTVYGAGRLFRIVCVAKIAERQIRSWQRKSLPQAKRRASANNVGMFDMDQRRMALQCFHDTAIELHVRKGSAERGAPETWAQVPLAETRGSIFDDPEIKRAFKVIDQDSVVNRLFGDSDGPMIQAAMEVMGAAGWGDAMSGGADDDTDEWADELDPRRGR